MGFESGSETKMFNPDTNSANHRPVRNSVLYIKANTRVRMICLSLADRLLTRCLMILILDGKSKHVGR